MQLSMNAGIGWRLEDLAGVGVGVPSLHFIAVPLFYFFYQLQKEREKMMGKNNFLVQMAEKAQQRISWKKDKKQLLLDVTRKDAGDNPVYRVLKHQRDTKNILEFLLGGPGGKHSVPLTHLRSRSVDTQQLISHKPAQKYSKARSIRQKQTFREKTENIMFRTKRMSEQLQGSKRRIKILGRFNQTVERYCSRLPENEEMEDESIIGNEDINRMCNEDLYTTQSLSKRASSCIKYQQPKIPAAKLKKLKERYRINAAVSPTSQRMVTCHA